MQTLTGRLFSTEPTGTTKMEEILLLKMFWEINTSPNEIKANLEHSNWSKTDSKLLCGSHEPG